MKFKWNLLILCIAIPLIVGGLSGIIVGKSIEQFLLIKKPPLSPPGWIFPIVWTVLFILMGIASYLVIVSSNRGQDTLIKSLKVYGIQLIFNFFWSIWFFNFNLYFFSFIWLITLWILIFITIILFYKISKFSAYLMIPYIIWVTFAGYLNLGIALLN